MLAKLRLRRLQVVDSRTPDEGVAAWFIYPRLCNYWHPLPWISYSRRRTCWTPGKKGGRDGERGTQVAVLGQTGRRASTTAGQGREGDHLRPVDSQARVVPDQ